ncbi:MAG TPA: SpoIIE family protein phosphatase [Opitutaceae bacterium]
MKWFVLASLRARLMALVLLSVFPALGLIFHTASQQRGAAVAAAQLDAVRIARLASSGQERLIEGARQLLVMMAHLPDITTDDRAAATQLLASIHQEYPLYTIFSVVDADGTMFASSLPPPDGLNLSDRTYFRRALETRQFTMGDYTVGRTTRKPSVHFSLPVFDAGGAVRRVVVVGLDLEWLEHLAAEAELPPGATLQVVDGTGMILAGWPEPERWRGASIRDSSISRRMSTLTQGAVEEIGPDGMRRLYAFAPLRGALGAEMVRVCIGIPTQVALADANRFLRRNLLLLGVVTAFALAAAWIGGDKLVLRHVRKLLNATRRVEAGDFSARTDTRYGRHEIGELSRAFDQMAATLQTRSAERDRALAELHLLNEQLEHRVAERTAELREKHQILKADLELAREFQLGLLPAEYPAFGTAPGSDDTSLRFSHRYVPSGAVGGDFFDILPLSNQQAGIFVCDVMGHGIRAALVTAILRGLLAELRGEAHDPAGFVGAINRSLTGVLRGEQLLFASAFYMVADVGRGRLTSTSAGHPLPLHIRRAKHIVEPVFMERTLAGPALGIFPDHVFASAECPLAPGDALLAFTDGVSEVAAPSGEQYGEARLQEAVRRNIDLPVEGILDRVLDEVRAFSQADAFEDDLCLVGIEVTPSPSSSPAGLPFDLPTRCGD